MLNISNEDGLTTLRLNHGKVNSLDLELCQTLMEQLAGLEADRQCKAVIFTSQSRVFSAGVDLKRAAREDVAYLDAFLPALTGLFQAFLRFEKPMVAAINGHAVAGGCILTSACDVRLAVPRARVGIPELRVGVPLPTVGIEIMRLIAAPSHFQQIVNLGATYVGEDALRVGLVDEIVPKDELTEQARQRAISLADIPKDVFKITKQQIRQPAFANIEKGESLFGKPINDLWKSEEIRSVIQRYIKKRL